MVGNIRAWLQLVRVKQWAKNLFLFIPPFFAGAMLAPDVWWQSILGFFSFSLVASSVYILNDWFDIERDKRHPEKQKRPLASGLIKVNHAVLVMGLLLIAGFLPVLVLGVWYGAIILTYLLMNIAYTMRLKHIALVDVTIIATGFLLRIFAGGFATDIPISNWLVLIAFLLALFLAMAKRRDEYIIMQQGINTREAIEGYNLQFIDVSMVLIGAVTVVSYIMYTLSELVQQAMGSHHLYLTTFLVILGILRYLQQTIVFKKSGSPTKLLWTDHFLQLIIVLWVLSFGVMLYLK